jgi:hypothetical protein
MVNAAGRKCDFGAKFAQKRELSYEKAFLKVR